MAQLKRPYIVDRELQAKAMTLAKQTLADTNKPITDRLTIIMYDCERLFDLEYSNSTTFRPCLSEFRSYIKQHIMPMAYDFIDDSRVTNNDWYHWFIRYGDPGDEFGTWGDDLLGDWAHEIFRRKLELEGFLIPETD